MNLGLALRKKSEIIGADQKHEYSI